MCSKQQTNQRLNVHQVWKRFQNDPFLPKFEMVVGVSIVVGMHVLVEAEIDVHHNLCS
jgi:hypothetical protein